MVSKVHLRTYLEAALLASLLPSTWYAGNCRDEVVAKQIVKALERSERAAAKIWHGHLGHLNRSPNSHHGDTMAPDELARISNMDGLRH